MFKRGLDTKIEAPRSQGSGSDFLFSFFLDYDKSAEVIFLDEKEMVPSELVHGLYPINNPDPVFNDRMQAYIPCTKNEGDCELCDICAVLGKDNNQPYARQLMFFSVLDLTPYERKNGEVIKYSKKILITTAKASSNLYGRELKEMGVSGLRGVKMRLSRGPKATPKPAAVGDKCRYLSTFTEAELLDLYGEAAKPFELETLGKLVIYDKKLASELIQQYKVSRGLAENEEEAEVAANTTFDKVRIPE
jgi:hypothetical protein